MTGVRGWLRRVRGAVAARGRAVAARLDQLGADLHDVEGDLGWCVAHERFHEPMEWGDSCFPGGRG